MAEYRISGLTVIQASEDASGWRPEELPAMTARKTTTGANVRSGPSVNLPIVATLKAGVRVLVLGVEDNGMVLVAPVGWISKELLDNA